jgi:cytochrome P450
MKIYPYYPQPAESKISSLMTLFKKNRSWLDGLYAKSYRMKMGHVRLPGVDLYIPNEPDLVYRILVSEVKNFPKNPLLHQVLVPLLGESIFTTNGRQWQKQRNLLNPSFEKESVRRLFPMMKEAVADMLERLDALADRGGYHNLDEEMTFVTADIIFRTILSSKLDPQEGRDVLRAFVTFQEMSAKMGMQRLFLLPKIFRIRSMKRYEEAGQVIRGALSRRVEPRYRQMERGEKAEERDILAALLQSVDKETGRPFSFKEILDQIAMLFLAGHETTASSLSWTLYLLALYPEHQEAAYREIVSVCGAEGEITLDAIGKLPTVTNIFKEALRLYPPVSFMAREAAVDTRIRDKEIKKGSYVVVSPWLMHRNERFWEDPHMFNPDRFNHPEKLVKNTYFPFGMGQRICIGAAFAMQEGVLILASIVRRYRLELKPGFVPDIVGRLTTRSANGIEIGLHRR